MAAPEAPKPFAERHYTVLGNITRGQIMVSGGGLIPPWAPLNMEGI